MAISTYLSIITWNVVMTPIKRFKVAEWIQKQDLYVCCLQETHFRYKYTHKVKVRGLKKKSLMQEEWISDKKGYYIMINILIQQEYVTILNVCAPNGFPGG